jgi:hypothetical protein
VLAIFATYRLASMISKDEGPYLPFLYKDPKQSGVFEWLRMQLGVYDYGPDGKPETNLARGLSCPLCTGVYLSLVVVLLAYTSSKIAEFFLAWMGVSGAQVFLENLTSDDALVGAIEQVADSSEESNNGST